MAFLKYAHATVVQPEFGISGWDEVRAKAMTLEPAFGERQARVVLQKYQPDQHLLSHCTIIASVDTEDTGLPTGRQMVDGFQIDRRWSDYFITPETTKYINNNHDSFERRLLLSSFKTFVGAENYVEHLQIPEMSKGKIVDAVARDIGDSIYVDILVATDRKHGSLVNAIKTAQLQTLSMGAQVAHTTCTKCGNVAEDEAQLCFPPGTRVLRHDGTYIPIEDVVVGDLLVTHKGNTRPVTETMVRPYDGELKALTVDGIPSVLRSTPDHPYWVLRPATVCACGCNQPLHRTVEHERGSWKSFKRRFLLGHNTRLRNPNPHVDNVVGLDEWKELFELELEFVEAQDIRAGDYLTFPIPQGEILTADATEDKARLIGYFAAEGSFIKRDGKLVGVSFDFGSHERETLVKETADLLAKVFGRPRTPATTSWEETVQEKGILPIQRRSTSRPVSQDVSCISCGAPSEYALNARFKPGRDDCYKCKVCGRCWIQDACHDILPRIYDNGSRCSVRLLDQEAAQFFFTHCGEYASAKRLSEEVMLWPANVQSHVLRCWLGGDGTQNAEGIVGGTTSFNLCSQMHVIAARCGMYSRRSVVFGGKATTVQEVVNGDGSVTTRDHRGWLPLFSVTCPEPVGFSGEVRFDDFEGARVRMAHLTEGFKRVGDWLIYRVRSNLSESYSGPVHNVEVEGDHSYVVDGVAAHNCPHIRFMKGNTFIDGLGKKRKIAELCGNIHDEPGSVRFIEASWVANPAFTGAVLRSILSPEEAELFGDRIQVAFSQPPRTADPKSMQRAARSYRLGQFDFGDEGGGEEGAEPKEEKSPADEAIDEYAKFIREKALEKVRGEMAKGEIPRADLEENRNETLVKEAVKNDFWRKIARNVCVKVGGNNLRAKRMVLGLLLYKQGGWRQVQASTAKFSGRELLALSRLLDGFEGIGIAGESRVYRTVIATGGVSVYADENGYLAACRQVYGRNLTGSEKDALVAKGRVYDLRKS